MSFTKGAPTKAIVTGSTGFVGSHLVERLLAEGGGGGTRVICLVRPATDTTWLKTLRVEIRPADDPHALADADLIFHVAGLTRGRSLAEYLAANAAPTQKLLDAAPATLQRFVYVSSLAAVGPNLTPEPQDESTVPHPHDDYGKSKLAGERIVLAAAHRLPITILRPPGVYGPRDTNLLPIFRTARRWGFVPSLGGGGDKQISLVHVQDLARGIHLAALSPAAIGQTFFLASGTYTMQDFTAALSAALGKPLKLRPIPALLGRLAGEFGQLKWALTGKPQIMSRRKVHDLLQPRWTCTWEKARQAFGYQQQMPLDKGLCQTWQWYERTSQVHLSKSTPTFGQFVRFFNSTGYRSFEMACIEAKSGQNPYIEICHILGIVLSLPDSDIHRILKHFEVDSNRLAEDLRSARGRLPKDPRATVDFSNCSAKLIYEAWRYGIESFKSPSVRTGHWLVALVCEPTLREHLLSLSDEFRKIQAERLWVNFASMTEGSPEAPSS